MLVIAGSEEVDHQKEVAEKIEQLGLEKFVKFTGLLLGQEKRDAFSAADFFVLPTKREAAPVVVLEALGAGLPVLTTTGTPWQTLVARNCGWWVDVDPQALASALSDALSRTPGQLRAMGQKGKELVIARYMWKETARMTIALYNWLLERDDRPDFVILD
jgi:glycosyltransferase involved in cell wall biosynthesis